ncbi:hypothetical protein QOZ80_7AG0570650 [Eleusine coracana subsp. coracana]|nr:hypothetical protein QOZ80_7AG0570650 [Eleusine coracana subsp. coracana]
MALAPGLFMLPLLLFSFGTEASEVGVCYGRVADNLPDPATVSKLLNDNSMTMVRIYDADDAVLTSLANTGIKVMVMMPNQNIADAASSPSNALQWVKSNVVPHLPDTQIHGVAVGNEVFKSNPDLNLQLVPAMNNVHGALVQLGLDNNIKVSTPISFEAIKDGSFPPSNGRFNDDIAQPVMKPMLDFLKQTGSYLTMNIYPFFAYAAQPDKINLDYALGNSNPGVPDENTGDTYYNLLDAQRDTAHYAMEALGDYAGVSLYVTENNWPARGRIISGGGRRLLDTSAPDGGAETIANAQAYVNNLINRVLAGQTGTPHRPNADFDVYIFALFNEDNKGSPDNVEANFGLFYPNMTKVYDFSFQGTGKPPAVPTPAPESWCVANAAVGDNRLQASLDYACGHGADCSAIQPGGSCFDPNTKLAHASYAVNSYYQSKNRAAGACDFNGAASIVYQKPAGAILPARNHFKSL